MSNETVRKTTGYEKLTLILQIISVLFMGIATYWVFYDHSYEAECTAGYSIEYQDFSGTISEDGVNSLYAGTTVCDVDAEQLLGIKMEFTNKRLRTIYIDKFYCLDLITNEKIYEENNLDIEAPSGKKIRKLFTIKNSSLEIGDKIQGIVVDTLGQEYEMPSCLITE